MALKKTQGIFSWVVIASEMSHVFCCVLPTLFSVITFLVGLGMIGAMPMWMDSMHLFMHDYEIPLITTSGIIVLLGWGLHIYAQRIDCHDTGCGHGSCAPKKKNSVNILKIATALFLVNVSIYLILHADVFNVADNDAARNEIHEDHQH